MLSSKKNFVVTIGDHGAVVALHDGNDIKNKIFLEELNEESKIDLKNLFSKNHSIPVSILLDTVDQSYKKKTYPLIKRSDLEQIIKRDLASDGDNESFKNFILHSNKKKSVAKNSASTARNECIFISVSNSEFITKWLDFLLDMPNRIIGIYMLPIEAFKLFELLKKDVDFNSRAKSTGPKNVYFLILHNKASGVRQIIFSDQGIIFTRSVNYDLEAADFLEKYEQDIYSTFEYLKRLLPDIRISEIDIVNIFSDNAITKIKTISSSEMNFVNYTPYEAAQKIGYGKSLPDKSNYCDLLVSKVFSDSKKILKFTTPRIKVLEKFFLGVKLSRYLNVGLILFLLTKSFSVFIIGDRSSDMLSAAEESRTVAMQELNKIQASNSSENNITENGNPVSVERIIDLGKVDELMSSIGTNISVFYSKLRFLRDEDVRLNNFSYNLRSFDYKNPVKTPYYFNIKGDLKNSSGDIDDMFKSFDSLVTDTKSNFPKLTVNFTEIPRNIDFVQKYYNLPIEFTISQ